MKSLSLRGLGSRLKIRSPRQPRQCRAALELQQLEPRQMMTVGVFLDAASKTLTIDGSGGNDVAHVEYAPVVSGNPTTVNVRLQFASGSETDASFPLSSVTSLVFSGQGGDDLVLNATTLPLTSSTNRTGTVSTSLTPGDSGANSSSQTSNVGVYTVGSTGQVNIDYLYDGASYHSQLGIYSLSGMGSYTPGTAAYNEEAARRVLTDSTLGHVAISVRTETAKFDSKVPWESDTWSGHGSYLGAKTFAMTPGDTFGVMLVPNGLVRDVYNNPSITGASKPLYSIPAANPYTLTPQFRSQAGDLDGQGSIFAIEDTPLNAGADRDYDDIVFQVTGARGVAAPVQDVVNPHYNFLAQPIYQSIESYASAKEEADTATTSLGFRSGLFTVGSTGQVSVDYVYDGATYHGELGVFSLQGMGNLTPGSSAFIQEASRRALSNTVLGHVVISSRTQTAKNDVKVSWEADTWSGHGSYLGPKTVAMTPGDTFATILIPNSTLWESYNNPANSDQNRPLFSIPEANPSSTDQLADMTGSGTTFGYEDTGISTGKADADYEDMVFRVTGATGTAPSLASVVSHRYDITRTGLASQILA